MPETFPTNRLFDERSEPGASVRFLSLLVATAAGAWLRGRGMDAFALTHWDEGLAWRGARYFWTLGAEGHYSPSASPPMVPLLFAIAAKLGGEVLLSAVAVNGLLSTLAILLAYLLVRELAGARAGIVVAFLFAGSGLQVMYARSLLTESAYVFFMLATLCASVRHLATGRVFWLVLASGSAVCLQYTKYNGCLAGVPLGLVLVGRLVRPPLGVERRRVLARCAILLVPMLVAIGLNGLAIARLADLDAFLGHYRQYVGERTPTPAELVATLTWVTPISVCIAGLIGVLLLAWRPRPGTVLVHLALLLYVLFLFRYRLYLRLLVPVVTLLLICAAVFLGRVFTLRPRWLGNALGTVLVALVALDSWRGFDRLYLERFDGYERVAAWLNDLEDPVPMLFVTQDNVWDGLATPAEVALLPSERANAVLDRGPEVILVCDVWFSTRQKPWDLWGVFERLEEDYPAWHFENTLNLDAVQNSLTLEQLRALESDPELRRRVLSIHVFRLPSDALRRIVQECAFLRE